MKITIEMLKETPFQWIGTCFVSVFYNARVEDNFEKVWTIGQIAVIGETFVQIANGFDFISISNNNIIEIMVIRQLPQAKQALLLELKDKVQAWWDEVYPASIFTGASGDDGAIKIKQIRDLLGKINADDSAEKT